MKIIESVEARAVVMLRTGDREVVPVFLETLVPGMSWENRFGDVSRIVSGLTGFAARKGEKASFDAGGDAQAGSLFALGRQFVVVDLPSVGGAAAAALKDGLGAQAGVPMPVWQSQTVFPTRMETVDSALRNGAFLEWMKGRDRVLRSPEGGVDASLEPLLIVCVSAAGGSEKRGQGTTWPFGKEPNGWVSAFALSSLFPEGFEGFGGLGAACDLDGLGNGTGKRVAALMKGQGCSGGTRMTLVHNGRLALAVVLDGPKEGAKNARTMAQEALSKAGVVGVSNVGLMDAGSHESLMGDVTRRVCSVLSNDGAVAFNSRGLLRYEEFPDWKEKLAAALDAAALERGLAKAPRSVAQRVAP